MAKKKTTEDATAFALSENCELLNIVKQNGKYIICAGKFKVTNKEFKTIKDAEEYIASKPYELIINLCCLFVTLQIKENDETQTKENAAKVAKKEQK